MLHHALRIQHGQGIYVAPSIDFIPYLYTPLYPGLLALFGHIFGLTYTTARMISVLSLVGIAVLAGTSLCGRRNQLTQHGESWVGLMIGLGAFAAAYPFSMAGTTSRAPTRCSSRSSPAASRAPRAGGDRHGLARTHARRGGGDDLRARVLHEADRLRLRRVRRADRARAQLAARVRVHRGGGGARLRARRAVRRDHRRLVLDLHVEDPSRARLQLAPLRGFVRAHPRPLSAVHRDDRGCARAARDHVVARRRRAIPSQAHPLLLWSAAYAVSTLVGAIGYGTEWAVYNAFMPGVPARRARGGRGDPGAAACARLLWPRVPSARPCWSRSR